MIRAFCLIVLLGLCAACSIKTPEITLTGEKTALENQIIGSFEQLNQQDHLTTSVRTALSDEAVTGKSESVIQALQNQQFIQDEIDELKRDKVIGENNSGYLEILGNEKYQKDPLYRKQVDRLVEEENNNRRIIYQKAAMSAEWSTSTASALAKLQQEKAAPGTMIQLESGEWIEKPRPKK
ncbi:MAG: YdbL family protein [candidate division KSB1 bacterium]|nr:YdbL family protein [candidate division KSB1 bacterium]